MARGSLGTLTVRIKADAGSLSLALKRTQNDVKKWGTRVNDRMRGVSRRLERGVSRISKSFATLGAVLGVGVGLGSAIKEASAYETALVGVVKTTNLAGDELKTFEKDLQGISRRFAVTTAELFELSTAAGQLGVKGGKNLALFSETMARLARSSDVVGEDGAKAIARILNVTKEGVGVIDQFASSLVALGNSSAASEAEILHMATFVSQSISAFGASSSEVLGLSAAMKSLGLRAELSGSAVGRAFRLINQRIQAGGEASAKMAAFLGLKVADLRKEFKTDSLKTFVRFLKALREEGDRATIALGEMGLKGDENARVFPVLANNIGLVETSLKTANQEFANNTALLRESSQFNETFSAKLVIFQNSLRAVSRTVGSELLPAFSGLLTEINFVFDSGESRAEAFELFLKAKGFDILNGVSKAVKSIATLIVSTLKKAFLEVREIFQNALRGMLIELENFANGAAAALNIFLPGQFEVGATNLRDLVPLYEAPSFGDIAVGDFFGVEDSFPNPYQMDLDEARQAYERLQSEARFDNRGLPANDAAGELFNLSQGVEDAVEAISHSADGMPTGSGAIDTALFGGGGSDELVKDVETVQATIVKVGEELNEYQREIASFGEQTFDNLANFVTEFAETGTVDIQRFATAAIAEFAKMQLKMLATRALLGLSQSGGGVGSFFGAVSQFFGISGARASGGPVSAGKTYLVGEQGAELFTPNRNGSIISNDNLANATTQPSGLAFTQVNHYDGNPNEEQMAVFAEQTKRSAIEGVIELIAHGGQPANAFAQ
jgi:TP901 family phage tail tape measure protein